MTWIVVAVATIAVVEIFRLLPVAGRLRRLGSSCSKAARTIGSRRISDRWKEKVLVAYAGRIFCDSLIVFVLCALALAPVAVAIYGGAVAGLDVYHALISVRGILLTCVLSLGYLYVRGRFS